jgi:signal transduction histidine kinase
VVEQMWRAVGVFRVVTLVYAGVLIFRDYERYAHPAGGILVLGIMVGWSALTTVAYARSLTRRAWLVVTDVAVAVVMVISTRWVETVARIDHGAATLPVCWVAASVLACAVAGGPWAGLAGAATVSAADVIERQALPQNTFNGIVLLLIAGVVGGHVVRLVLRAEATADGAARLEAATTERERIARDIHDSVLQVLALVSMRGQELGGEAADLGRLAGEQEKALRSLVAVAPSPALGGQVDLRTLLEPLAGERITVSCPANAVSLPDATARALAAATSEALENARRHAGLDARAWVLLEDEGGAVTVSVRDDGTGFAASRLAQALEAGRIGVAQSIVGRLHDVGGEADVISTPGQGTEVELRVPRD